jgi:hypothetical protein
MLPPMFALAFFIFGNHGPAPESKSVLSSMDGTDAPLPQGPAYAHGGGPE